MPYFERPWHKIAVIVAIVALAVAAGTLAVTAVATLVRWLRGARREQRGFEVKPTTGKLPVPQEERDKNNG